MPRVFGKSDEMNTWKRRRSCKSNDLGRSFSIEVRGHWSPWVKHRIERNACSSSQWRTFPIHWKQPISPPINLNNRFLLRRRHHPCPSRYSECRETTPTMLRLQFSNYIYLSVVMRFFFFFFFLLVSLAVLLSTCSSWRKKPLFLSTSFSLVNLSE